MRNFQIMSALSLSLVSLFAGIPVALGEQKIDSSSADIRISLSIQPSMKIVTTTDVRLDITDRSRDTNISETFCVKGNTGSKYRIIAQGTTDAQNRFALSNIDGEQLIYTLGFRGKKKPAKFLDLLPNLPSPDFSSIGHQDDCKEGAAFRINFRTEDLQAVSSGLFSGALTLLASPI